VPDLPRALALLAEMDARLVAVGHGRGPGSIAAARAFLDAWPHDVAAIVDWPPTAASWLRQAQRLTECGPDAWVIADTAAGWANVERRLRETGTWDPMRTVILR
jgi:hypothetical protein